MKSKGITLIALVITIIVIIILLGVVLSLILGEHGILKRAEEAKAKENENSAREKLELVLVEARIEKETNADYNKEEFLNNMLGEKNITTEGDTEIVDNYMYLIDREQLIIVEKLGEVYINITTALQQLIL